MIDRWLEGVLRRSEKNNERKRVELHIKKLRHEEESDAYHAVSSDIKPQNGKQHVSRTRKREHILIGLLFLRCSSIGGRQQATAWNAAPSN
jgi:hypothetical protein